jgi:hypothetical protein
MLALAHVSLMSCPIFAGLSRLTSPARDRPTGRQDKEPSGSQIP